MNIILRDGNGKLTSLNASILWSGNGCILVCAWCGKVRSGKVWLELEGGMERSGLLEPSLASRLSHGMCRSCSVELMKELEQWHLMDQAVVGC